MATTFPDTIAAYFRAKNLHDTAAMSACFAETAIVHDEEQDIRGIAAIENWLVTSSEKYQDTINVSHIDEQNGDTIVTGQVSGNFPGSPIELQFYFILEGDKIINLKIG